MFIATACSAGSPISGQPGLNAKKHNQLQLIRNATMKITYAGKTFLTDPMFAAKGSFNGFIGVASNPTVELPFPEAQILAGVESVIVSHLHPDHFDRAAMEAIAKELPIFCQSGDEDQITLAGFKNVKPVGNSVVIDNITITRVGGQHGKGKILEKLGKVSGFVLQAPGEPTVYWVGDSIWCPEVAETIKRYQPEVIITHSGAATIPGHAPIIMDAEQTFQLISQASGSLVISIHLEALDHCGLSRSDLRKLARLKKISDLSLLIPADGAEIQF